MDDDFDDFDLNEYLKNFGHKDLNGKFLTRVGPDDLDEEGRFICKEPVIIIGSQAFKDVRDKLTYAKIDGVISIENEAFADCEKLEKADIGFELDYKYPQDYDAYMFWKDKAIDTEEDYDYYMSEFCQKFGLYDVHIKDGAFKNCINLKSFHFPARVVLHDRPFENCSNLTELTFDGAIRLQIRSEIIKEMELYEMPLHAIIFKNCSNVQKMTFGKGAIIDVDELAPFEHLQEINLSCGYHERQNFWYNAIVKYPEFFLILPSFLFQDQRFMRQSLRPLAKTLEEAYGYPACKNIYNNLIVKKIKIEKEKEKHRKKEIKEKIRKGACDKTSKTK